MALCMAMATPPAGNMHKAVSGNGLHAWLCNNVDPVVFCWPPSTSRHKLYPAGPDERQMECCLLAQWITEPLQQDPTSENMFAVADTIITIFNSEQLL